MIAILTGLPFDEIIQAAPDKKAWHSRDFIATFRKLGFNTSDRFIKFDEKTDKPCIMRTTSDRKGYWYGWVYYDEMIYIGNHEGIYLDTWKKDYNDLKITSMLQVWI